MALPGSRPGWKRLAAPLRGALTVVILATAALLFANGKPAVCHDEMAGNKIERLCRGPELGDPLTIIIIIALVAILGWTITEISVGGTTVSLNNSNNSAPQQIQDQRVEVTSDNFSFEANRASNIIKLLVAGSARSFPSDDAFLIILYESKSGILMPLEFASSRPSAEDVRLRVIAESQALRSLAAATIQQRRSLFDWVTPFPEVNSLVRKCVATPISGISGWEGSLVGVALIDGKNETSMSDLAISGHLQTSVDTIAKFIRIPSAQYPNEQNGSFQNVSDA